MTIRARAVVRDCLRKKMMLFGKIILFVFTVGITLLVNYLDYKNPNRRTGAFKKGRKWLFVLTIIFMVGTIVLMYIDDNQNSHKESSLKAEIEELNNQLETQNRNINSGFNRTIAQNTLLNNSPNSDLRERAMILSNNILAFISKRKMNEPIATIAPFIIPRVQLFKYGKFNKCDKYESEMFADFHRQNLVIGMYNVQTSILFIQNFGTRWESIVAELKSIGITHILLKENSQYINVNEMAMGEAATALGEVAIRMPKSE